MIVLTQGCMIAPETSEQFGNMVSVERNEAVTEYIEA